MFLLLPLLLLLCLPCFYADALRCPAWRKGAKPIVLYFSTWLSNLAHKLWKPVCKLLSLKACNINWSLFWLNPIPIIGNCIFIYISDNKMQFSIHVLQYKVISLIPILARATMCAIRRRPQGADKITIIIATLQLS